MTEAHYHTDSEFCSVSIEGMKGAEVEAKIRKAFAIAEGFNLTYCACGYTQDNCKQCKGEQE
jgi:hypothetical protein